MLGRGGLRHMRQGLAMAVPPGIAIAHIDVIGMFARRGHARIVGIMTTATFNCWFQAVPAATSAYLNAFKLLRADHLNTCYTTSILC